MSTFDGPGRLVSVDENWVAAFTADLLGLAIGSGSGLGLALGLGLGLAHLARDERRAAAGGGGAARGRGGAWRAQAAEGEKVGLQ